MRFRSLIAGLTILGSLLVAASSAPARPPRWIWNATASAPEGLYLLQSDAAWGVGDLVAVQPDGRLADWMDDRGYAPSGVLLVKRVAALAPSKVCRAADAISIDGIPAARARTHDRVGRDLPVWRGCHVLTPRQVFLLNTTEGSLDSRYLGPLARASIVGPLAPVWRKPEHRDAR